MNLIMGLDTKCVCEKFDSGGCPYYLKAMYDVSRGYDFRVNWCPKLTESEPNPICIKTGLVTVGVEYT